MNKKEIMELSRRLKKDACTFTRMCGCYVDAEKNKVVNFGQTFLNLEEEEYYKYLELAKKVFSGKVGNNLLTLDIPFEEESAGGKQQFLMGLRESRLKNDELLERFYDHIIETYSYAGNYLILVFHDAYDVPLKTTDNNKLDESEEINACTVKIQVELDGKTEPWLLLFKNETHNHPTENEPFGGAATCIGGAIRDPLSGRSYV